MQSDWVPTVVNLAGMFLMTGGVAWYVKDLSDAVKKSNSKIDALSNTVASLSKEYVLKEDCKTDHNKIEQNLADNTIAIEDARERLSYLEGASSGL